MMLDLTNVLDVTGLTVKSGELGEFGPSALHLQLSSYAFASSVAA